MFRDLIISFSFANICLCDIWLRFFYRSKFNMKYYPTANSFLALIINELIFTFCIWGCLRLIRRFNNKILLRVIKILVCLEVLSFIIATSNSFPAINDEIFNIVLLAIILVLLWRRAMVKTMMTLILLLTPFAFIILGQSVQGIVYPNHENDLPIISREIVKPVSNTPRVLWLIFDEMDQRISFIDRPQHLKLPEFDRFKEQSFFAENAYPPANGTIPSIPALIDGRLISSSRRLESSIIKVIYEGSNQEENWGSRSNVFRKAKALGVNTALIGEYIPYTRLIGHDLDYCTWSAYRYQYVSAKDTLWDNLTTQIYSFFHTLELYYQQQIIATREILDGARKLAVDSRYGLVFIHFPVPHSPFIHHRAWWDQFPKGYADNLALCDQILGQIRKDMESKGVWEDTNIIISSDHSYRDSEKFDGKKDQRVPFMVKLANQEEAIVYSKKFNTVLTHNLVLDILSKKVTTPAEIVHWLELHEGNCQNITKSGQ